MGAALNFGRAELGINSPTHRNTHAEEDLFGTADVVSTTVASTPAAAGQNELLYDIFQTCSSAPTADDDFFNPRDEESHEFGDFASAFGTTTATATAPVAPHPSAVPLAAPKKDEFADFSSAFTSAPNPNPVVVEGNTDILFGAVSPVSNPIASNPISSGGGGADLLSDLDGLSLGAPISSGECFFVFLLFEIYLKNIVAT